MVTGVPATISVRDLRKSYGAVHAVDGVSFEVEQGEFFGILGPNGAGKTTTLEIVEGLREADSGEVTVLGRHPWPRDRSLLPQIGVQLQASSFFELLTAREQLRTFASLYGVSAPCGRYARRGRARGPGGHPHPSSPGSPNATRWPACGCPAPRSRTCSWS